MSFVLEVVEQYSKEGLMLKMKFQHLGYLMWRPSSLEETLMLGKTVAEGEVIKEWDCDMAWQTQRTWVEETTQLYIVKDREACFVAEHVITKRQTWLSNWTIPMRTQDSVKALVLDGVEKYFVGRGGFPSSGAGPWIQGKEHKILNVLPNIV